MEAQHETLVIAGGRGKNDIESAAKKVTVRVTGAALVLLTASATFKSESL